MQKRMDETILKTNSTSKSIFFSTCFSLIAKLLSFVQAMIVSYYFGATKSTDFLFFCVSITVLLPGLFNNINQYVIVPNTMRIREQKSEEDSRKFLSYIYVIYLAVGVLLCGLISLQPEEFMVLVSKFGRADVKENLLIVKLIIPSFFFTLTNSYLLDIFNSYRYFTLPMILDMVKSVLTILFIVLLGKRYGVVSMAAGILAAHAIQFLVLNGILGRLFHFRFSLRRYPVDMELRKNILYVVVSQVASILSQYITMYLISGLSEGVYTSLSYSDRLYGIFVLVFAGQATTVFGINFIEMYARGQYKKLNEQYLKYLKATMTLILPVCIILAFQAQTVISILFERGSFTRESVLLTSIFFQYNILVVPLLLMNQLIVRLIIAKQIMRISFLWNVISKILTCAVIYTIVVHIDYKYFGLGLLVVQFVNIVLLNLFMVRKEFRFIHVRSSLLYVGLSAVLGTVLCVAAASFFPASGAEGLLQKMVSFCIYSALVLAGYYLIGYFSYNRETIAQLIHHARELIPGQSRMAEAAAGREKG